MTAHYPNHAGYTDHETSKDAAEAIEGNGHAQTLRDNVLRTLRRWRGTFTTTGYALSGGLTADEIARKMVESPFSIRPRITELAKQGLIEKTGQRRKSSNGRPSHVWRLK